MADHYLPGFKAGGPIRTLHNLIQTLGDDFRFLVITRDRDLSDIEAYPGVRLNEWVGVGKASVLYVSPDNLSWRGLGPLLDRSTYDALYLNSFFSPLMTVLPLLKRRLSGRSSMPVILAPRGEFAPGALALKPVRKRIYLALARATGLLNGLRWQATSQAEKAQILSTAGARPEEVDIVPNLASCGPTAMQFRAPRRLKRAPGQLRMVFLSRIAPMKNLDFLIEALRQVSTPVLLTVHGPIVELPYWRACQDAAKSLPAHVAFNYEGEVQPDRVSAAFAAHDVFVFPTRGENFGHVILESLSAGTAVIVSDRTPWQADSDGALTVLKLDQTAAWARAIETWAKLDESAVQHRSDRAAVLANTYLSSGDAARAHRQLFDTALAAAADPTD